MSTTCILHEAPGLIEFRCIRSGCTVPRELRGSRWRRLLEVMRSMANWPLLRCSQTWFSTDLMRVAEIAHLWQDSATVKGHAWHLYRSTLLGSCRACTPLELAGEDSSGTLSTCGANLWASRTPSRRAPGTFGRGPPCRKHSPRNNTLLTPYFWRVYVGRGMTSHDLASSF